MARSCPASAPFCSPCSQAAEPNSKPRVAWVPTPGFSVLRPEGAYRSRSDSIGANSTTYGSCRRGALTDAIRRLLEGHCDVDRVRSAGASTGRRPGPASHAPRGAGCGASSSGGGGCWGGARADRPPGRDPRRPTRTPRSTPMMWARSASSSVPARGGGGGVRSAARIGRGPRRPAGPGSGREDERPLDDVLQLADVARPVVGA